MAAEARPLKHKKTPKQKAPKRNAQAALAIKDDPSLPLGESWAKQIDSFFRHQRPECGAFVAISPSTGEVIALSEHSTVASVPHPATTAAFPAASIFKIVSAAALLESGKVTPSTTVCYSGGSHSLEAAHLKDSRRDRACRSLASAFAHSTNAVFGKLAVRHLDAKGLLSMAERLGFNRVVAVGNVQAQSRAQLPVGELGLARMAAGFTNSTLAPLHAALIAAMIANGGQLPAGAMLRGVSDMAGVDTRLLPANVAARIREMMALTSRDGTAAKYFARYQGRDGGVAVKTGSLTSTDGSGRFNTWMVGFFPANRPEFAFAALVSTKGPLKAGHLARHAIEAYLKLKKARAGQS